uniref:PDZ domain containing 1 n=1 Tax=Crocodylus porosus TaxID=8502 RepID=A0A7M4EY65_CROPO
NQMTSILQPRECKLKRKNKKGYGFYLRIEKDTSGHLIRNVDKGSPAEKADLKDGDILVAVNGEAVEALDHDSVVQRIKKCGEKTTLLIVNKETDAMYKLAQVSPCLYYHEVQDPPPANTAERLASPAEPLVNHKPKICQLVKGPSGFGFCLKESKDMPGQFFQEVLIMGFSGPADKAGLEENDVLVEVNGVNIQNEPYDKTATRVQDGGDKLTLLVCTKAAYEYFKSQNIPISASMADPLPDTNDPPAYTESLPAEPERNSPEPRERVGSPKLLDYQGVEKVNLSSHCVHST